MARRSAAASPANPPPPSEQGQSIVAIVGIGDDGPAGLSPRARALVEHARVLCGGRRQLAFFPDHPAPRLQIRANLDTFIARLRALLAPPRADLEARTPARADSRNAEPGAQGSGGVVVLASGDPLFFGIGARLIEALGPERVEVLPHLSAVQLAFARLRVPWQDALVLSAHGRDLAPVVARALGGRAVAILTDPRHTPQVIARALLAAGMEPCRAFVLERLASPHERITALRLDELAQTDLSAPALRSSELGARSSELGTRSFDRLNVLVLLRERATRPVRLGLPEQAYLHRGGMITKAEVRAVALARLGLRSEAVVWDVGAGCGAIAIEAAALVPDGRVFAIERDPQQLALLRQNCLRHLATNVEVVAGEAPAALRRLPDPDAVFVGGSGGRLAVILRLALGRLRPRGRLVLNAVLLETLLEAQRLCQRAGWRTELCQVAIARGEPTAGSLRLQAANPVFVLTASRADDDRDAGQTTPQAGQATPAEDV